MSAVNNFQKSDQPIEISRANEKAFLYELGPAVKVYLGQTLAVMIFVFIGVLLLGYKLMWFDLFFDAGLSAWIAGAIYFGFSLWRWNSNSRLDNKPVVIAPDDLPTQRRVHVRHDRVKTNGHFQTEDYDLPGSPEALQVWARGMKGGRPFTESVWAGRNRPFAYREFRELRRLGMQKYGLFEYINPQEPKVGIQPTEKGWELIEELADGDMEEFEE